MNEFKTTMDGMLNRRVLLEQPAQGYRVAIDTALLASAVPALGGDTILDIGCGVGGAMLCAACRVPGLRGVGLEIQKELVEICIRNINRNTFAYGLSVRQEDVTHLGSDLNGQFDHVVMNPPYHEEEKHDVSADRIKQIANSEKNGALSQWIAGAASALKPAGTLTLIHRADRKDEIISLLKNISGDIEIITLHSRKDAQAKRMIVRARKNSLFSVRLCRPLILHTESGAYSENAENILRHAQFLDFQSP